MSALVYKVIKPSRLKEDALRLTLLNEIRKVGTQIKADFEKTTASWDHKVAFEEQVSLAGGPQVEIYTTDKIYGYVDQGTRPHAIRPVRAKALRFQSGYKAKTAPGVIGSGAGGPFGDTVFSKGVQHPGNAPRGFSKEIEKIWTPRFKRAMEKAMSQAAKASGHGM